MLIEIKRLTPDLAGDYFDFFDNRAFTDHAEWSFCYCTFFHIDKARERKIKEAVKAAGGGAEALRAQLRGAAEEFVGNQTIKGYLAYADGVAVGFCNAGDRDKYCFLSHDKDQESVIRGGGRVMAVTCFTIAPEFRGRGIAFAMLARAVSDAADEGYSAVEGYPRLREGRDPYDYTGPLRLYERAGFVRAAVKGDLVVMRFELENAGGTPGETS